MTTRKQQEGGHPVSSDGVDQPPPELPILGPSATAPSSSLGAIVEKKSPSRRVHATSSRPPNRNKPLWFDRVASGPSLVLDKHSKNHEERNDNKSNSIVDIGHDDHNVTQVMIHDSNTSVSSSLSGSMRKLGPSLSDTPQAIVNHKSEQSQKQHQQKQQPETTGNKTREDDVSSFDHKHHRKSADGTLIPGNHNNYNILSATAKESNKMSDGSCSSCCAAPRSLVSSDDAVVSITDNNEGGEANNQNNINHINGIVDDEEMAAQHVVVYDTSSTTSSSSHNNNNNNNSSSSSNNCNIDQNRSYKARPQEKKPHHIILERSITILVIVSLLILGIGLTLLKSPSSSTTTPGSNILDDGNDDDLT